MFSRKNALILKGNLPANDVLDILDTLIQEVARHTKSRPPPQPWELFSFICASGNLRFADFQALASIVDIFQSTRDTSRSSEEKLDRVS
jgi:hypothetical protein